MLKLKAGGGAKLVRSAGAYAQVVANDAGYTSIKMPSSEIRKIDENVLLQLVKYPIQTTI